MKNIKRALSMLLVCLLVMAAMPLAVSAAEGTQENPINANDKWFSGASCFLLNTNLEAGDTDGVWYELTVDTVGILQLDSSPKNDFAYQITMWVNGTEYKVYENGIYNRPVTTYPVAVGDVATICIKAQDTTQAGGLYANIKIISGGADMDDSVKIKNDGTKVYVAAGQTVNYQDDSTDAIFAAQGLVVSGDSVKNVEVISNSTSYTDTDGDGTIELKLGGSQGGTGMPPVKPAWAITNHSAQDRCFTLTVTDPDTTHECVYDDNTDLECNSCGAVREPVSAEPAVSFVGNSISEDVNGLAFKFSVDVAGMQMDGTTADYTTATIDGYTLVSMGAVVTNQSIADLTLNDVNGSKTLNVPAVYLYSLTADNATYAVRIIDIPDANKNTPITVRPYYVVNMNGTETVIYGDAITASYNNY